MFKWLADLFKSDFEKEIEAEIAAEALLEKDQMFERKMKAYFELTKTVSEEEVNRRVRRYIKEFKKHGCWITPNQALEFVIKDQMNAKQAGE